MVVHAKFYRSPRTVYPSFSLIVNRHILRHGARTRTRRRLVCTNAVSGCESRAVPAQQERQVDWAMTTMDRRDEEKDGRAQEGADVRHPRLKGSTATDTLPIDSATPTRTSLAQAGLHAVDDDALTDISDFDLDGDCAAENSQSEDARIRAKRRHYSKGARVFFTCKGFLEHCLRRLRGKSKRRA